MRYMQLESNANGEYNDCMRYYMQSGHIVRASLQAVCVEAGMLALRRDAIEVNHEDFNEGVVQVQAKKKANLNYYA